MAAIEVLVSLMISALPVKTTSATDRRTRAPTFMRWMLPECSINIQRFLGSREMPGMAPEMQVLLVSPDLPALYLLPLTTEEKLLGRPATVACPQQRKLSGGFMQGLPVTTIATEITVNQPEVFVPIDRIEG